MSSLIRCLGRSVSANPQWVRGFSGSSVRCAEDITNATKHREAPSVDVEQIISDPNQLKQRQRLSDTVSIPTETDLSSISGVPSEHIRSRRVRIFIPAKNAMQSGTNNVQNWSIEFDARERWENPLMGWSSSGDPLSNMIVDFNTKEEAAHHCEKNGWNWFIDGEEKPLKKRNKNYGLNFTWNTRSRVSTK